MEWDHDLWKMAQSFQDNYSAANNLGWWIGTQTYLVEETLLN